MPLLLSSLPRPVRKPSVTVAVTTALCTLLALLVTPATAVASERLQRIEAEGDQTEGRWQVFDLDVPRDEELAITATWSGDADVNLFLRTSAGDTLAYAISPSAQPERIVRDLKAGSYELAVLVKSGAASYVVDVTLPSAVPPVGDTIASSGDQSGGRWQTFPLDVKDGGTLTASVTWSGGGDVRLFLLEGPRTVAYVRSGSQPRVLEHPVTAGGDFTLAVLIKTGAATYTVATSVTQDSSPSEPETAPQPTSGYPGQPPAGQVLWGAAIGGNDDPEARHERVAGHPLAVRLTYYQWRHRTGYLLDTARDDLANDRLPWVLIKPPSWRDMAAGRHDREIDQLLRGLQSLDGPVWLTVHHEPAGGGGVNRPDDPGGPAAHVAMNRRVRQRIDALGVSNVSLGPVFMYWTWDERSGRDVEDWWAGGIYDFVGVTLYRDRETSLVFDRWYDIRRWAQRKGVDVGVAEWGMRGTDSAAGQRVRDWHAHAANSHRDGRGARVVAQVAFDSGLNSPGGSWELRGAQLEAFRTLLRDRRTADVVD